MFETVTKGYGSNWRQRGSLPFKARKGQKGTSQGFPLKDVVEKTKKFLIRSVSGNRGACLLPLGVGLGARFHLLSPFQILISDNYIREARFVVFLGSGSQD
jgi:hypothetical protein